MEVKETARNYNTPGERYTYSEYAQWSDEHRYELIDGFAYMMSAPSMSHQRILQELFRKFADYLDEKPCEVFIAPCDVCLSGKGDDDDTVVQPDIFIVCDESKITEKYCNGAPDLIIEVLSPSTAKLDRMKKLNKYLQAGVREYWIADPIDKGVVVHLLEDGKYVVNAYDENETISVNVLEGCDIALSDIF